MQKLFTVSLQGVEDLPPAERIAAEICFIKELERSLGGEDAVVGVYRAWSQAVEVDASELDEETSSLAIKWPKAFNAAQRAGLKNIGEGDAHFELVLVRQPISIA